MRPVVGLLLLALLVSPLAACQDLFDFPTIEDGVSPPPTEEELGFLQKAKSQEQAGDLNGAAATYRRAMKLSRGNVQAHVAYARMEMGRGNVEEARAILKIAYGINPDHPGVRLGLGKVAVHEKKAEKALKHFEKGLGKKPSNADLLNGKGVALDMLSRYTEAQEVYQAALKNAGEDKSFIQNNLALSYIMSGNYDGAIKLLESIQGVKESPVMRANLALAYGLKGDMTKAREWAKKDLSEEQLKENMEFYRQYRGNLNVNEVVPVMKPTSH